MKVAVLGTGFGAYHVELYQQMEAVEHVTVFGRNPEKLQRFANTPRVSTTTRMEEIFANPEIDLIDVCLPSALHREYVIKALEAGKHVFCETPLSLTAEDAHQMLAVRTRADQQVFVNLFLRFEFPYTYLQDLKQRTVYGELKSFRIQRKTPPIWGDLGADNIIPQLMIHDIDYTTWLWGKPRAVKACCSRRSPGQCAVTGVLEYETGFAEVIGSSMMPLSYPFAVAYEAVFEQAVVKYYEDGYKDRVENRLEVFTEQGVEQINIPQGNCYEAAIRYVLDCIQNQPAGQPVNGIAAAVGSLDLALEMQSEIQ